MAIPVRNSLGHRVASALTDIHPASLPVGFDHLVDRPVAELGNGSSLPVVSLSSVVSQFDCWEAVGESPEQATGVDLR